MRDLELDVCMTGCSNGCARPYNAEIGLVGDGHHPKSCQGKYTVFLGGSRKGNRLNEVYQEKVFRDNLTATLRPLLRAFSEEREPGENFGDFCCRVGVKALHRRLFDDATDSSSAPNVL